MVPPGGMSFAECHAIIVTMKHIYMRSEEGVLNRRERKDRRDCISAAFFDISALFAIFAVKSFEKCFLQNEPIFPSVSLIWRGSRFKTPCFSFCDLLLSL